MSMKASDPSPATPNLTMGSIAKDFVAGTVVFLVALPLCLGIAEASGAPPVAGLIAGIVGGIVVGLISNSHTSVAGPAAGLTVVIITQLEVIGVAMGIKENDPDLLLKAFPGLLTAILIAGFLQILMGVFRLGVIARFFPTSVIKGLLAAIGVILILKQIPHLIGFDKDAEGEMSFFQADHENTFTELPNAFMHTTPGPLIIGVTCLALLIAWSNIRFLKRLVLPPALVVVVLGAILAVVFNQLGGVWNVIGDHLVHVPEGGATSLIAFPELSPELLTTSSLWIAGFTIALVASLETLLNIEAVDRLDPLKRTTSPNRELVAQGVGNMVCGAIGGLPVTSVVIRSSVNIHAGGKTKLSAVVHGFVLMGCVLMVPFLLNTIPLACLAAVLIVTGFKLANPKTFLQMWTRGLDQFVPFVITLLAIVFSDLLIGTLIGLGISLFFILRSNVTQPLKKIREKHLGGDVLRIELGSQVSFLNRAALHRTMTEMPRGGHLLLDARNTVYLDHDVEEMIDEFEKEVAPAHGVQVSKIGFGNESNHPDQILYVDYATRELQQRMTPENVVQILMAGNERFQNGLRLMRNLGKQVEATAKAQFPLAVVLGCIDSRAPVEMIFDTGLGEVFSVRVAGNVADEQVLGSIEYGCAIAHAKLVLVLGHTSCGAVTAAVKLAMSGKTAAETYQCNHIDSLTSEIMNAIPDQSTMPRASDGEVAIATFVDYVARLNVVSTIAALRAKSPTLETLSKQGAIRIVGCLYNISTGKAEFFDEHSQPLDLPQSIVHAGEN